MADSIAKLAVILTGDEAPLSAAMQRSLRDVDRWALGVERAALQAQASWTAGLAKIAAASNQQRLGAAGGPMAAFDPGAMSPQIPSSAMSWVRETINPLGQLSTKMRSFVSHTDNLTSATLRMGMAMSAARGNVAAMVNLGLSGGPATWLVAGTVAAGALAFKLAAVSDAQKVLAQGGNTLDTWAGQWDRVQENAEKIGVTLGRPISNVLTRETQQLADILGLIADKIMPDTLKQERELIALRARQAEAAKVAAEKKAEAEKRAAEEARLLGEELERQGREMESRADALARSLRTPREEMVGALAEAAQLFEAGFLSAENYERAAAAAAEKFQEADKLRANATRAATSSVGAAERHTMAGFSAVQQSQRNLEQQVRLQQEANKKQDKEIQLQQETNDILRKMKPSGVTLTRSSIS